MHDKSYTKIDFVKKKMLHKLYLTLITIVYHIIVYDNTKNKTVNK